MADLYLQNKTTAVQAVVLLYPWDQEPSREVIDTTAPSSTVFTDLLLQKTTFVPLSKTQERQIENETIIRSFQDLPLGWNGYNAKSIPHNVVLRSIRAIPRNRD